VLICVFKNMMPQILRYLSFSLE